MFTSVLAGLGALALMGNPRRRRRARRRNPAEGVQEHIWYESRRTADGRTLQQAKTVCTSHVLAAFGICSSSYRYSGRRSQMAAILRRNGFAVRSRMSRLGKRRTMGAARTAIRGMKDPAGTRYLAILKYGDVTHAVLLDANGSTIVDTAPRDADRRRIVAINAVYPKALEASNPGKITYRRRGTSKRLGHTPYQIVWYDGAPTNYHLHKWGPASFEITDVRDFSRHHFGSFLATKEWLKRKLEAKSNPRATPNAVKVQEDAVEAILRARPTTKKAMGHGHSLLNRKIRVIHAIYKKMALGLGKCGYTEAQIKASWNDVSDMAKLEDSAREDS